MALQEERDRSNAIVEALRREQSEVEEQQNELIRQREAQLEAEKEQKEALAQQLQETKVCCLLLPFAHAHGAFQLLPFAASKMPIRRLSRRESNISCCPLLPFIFGLAQVQAWQQRQPENNQLQDRGI